MSVKRESQYRVQRIAEAASRRKTDDTRHRVFVSYHVDDEDEVTQFVDDFGDEFIGTVVGVTDDDDFVDSDDTDYIMDQIREKYLRTTTVTVVLIGACTWSRKYVDWEIYSSLREYSGYLPSGLVAISLPSIANSDKRLPARLDDNVGSGYAKWKKYPADSESLRAWIDDAWDARVSRSELIDNSRPRRQANSSC